MTTDIKNTTNDEIDLVELAKYIWSCRKTIYKITSIFLVLGIFYILLSPKEYKSEVKILVSEQESSGISGLLSQFGGMAGLNLGGSSNNTKNLSPDLYPDIIESTPFLINLINQKVYIKKYDTTTTVFHYLAYINPPSGFDILKKYTLNLPSTLLNAIKNNKVIIDNSIDTALNLNEPLKVSDAKLGIAGKLFKRIKIKDGKATGIINISVIMPDATASAQLSSHVVNLLIDYTINFKIQKANADYEFIKEQHKQAEIRYYIAQNKLAQFQDSNRGLSSASARSEGERLQGEYTIAYNVYNGLSQQLEQTKMKVQEKTPVIKIINPAKIPGSASTPNKPIIIFASLFLGLCIGTGYIITLKIIKSIK